jgi:hypothetical protein
MTLTTTKVNPAVGAVKRFSAVSRVRVQDCSQMAATVGRIVQNCKGTRDCGAQGKRAKGIRQKEKRKRQKTGKIVTLSLVKYADARWMKGF